MTYHELEATVLGKYCLTLSPSFAKQYEMAGIRANTTTQVKHIPSSDTIEISFVLDENNYVQFGEELEKIRLSGEKIY